MPESVCRRALRLALPCLVPALLALAALVRVGQLLAGQDGYGGRQAVINEVCARNLTGTTDGNGAHGDWIELYNPTDETLDLTGWSLSDDGLPGDWVFPDGTTIEPKSYRLVFADRADTVDGVGYIHTAFALNADGETISLYDAGGNLVHELKVPALEYDLSYGLAPGSASQTGTFARPTPGTQNASGFWERDARADWGGVTFSVPGGFYDEAQEVTLTADDADALIFYTTDGSDPAENGELYLAPVTIESRAGEPNRYVSQPSRFLLGEGAATGWAKNYAYDYAAQEVDKATTLTVRTYKDGVWSDTVSTQTYWVGVEEHTLPVVSLTADPDDLFGSEGIYTLGATYFTLLKYGEAGFNGNMYSGLSVTAALQFLTESGVQTTQAAVSVGGRGSRTTELKKNLLVTADTATDLFAEKQNGQSVDRYTLRGTGGVNHHPMLHLDAFINNFLYEQTTLGTRWNIPVALYVEDEYWGTYTLRENKSRDYYARRFGIDIVHLERYDGSASSLEDSGMAFSGVMSGLAEEADDELAILDGTALYGDMERVAALDPASEADWEWVQERFDLDNFERYLIAQLYYYNRDGAMSDDNSNLVIWRTTAVDDENPYADGRWRFMLNDFDATVYDLDADMFNYLLYGQYSVTDVAPTLFQSLWRFAQFREQFAALLREEMATTYAPENITAAFDAWCETLEPEAERDLARQTVERNGWSALSDALVGTVADPANYTMDDWYEDAADVRDYLLNRAAVLEEQLDDYLAEAAEEEAEEAEQTEQAENS